MRKQTEPGKPRILLIKLRYIGDTVLITPLVKALKLGMGSPDVDVLVYSNSLDILRSNPFVSRIWSFDYRRARSLRYGIAFLSRLRRQKYQVVADLTNNDRSAICAFVTGAPIRIGYTTGRRVQRYLFYNQMIESVFGSIHTVDHHLKVAELLGAPVVDRYPYINVPTEDSKNMGSRLRCIGVDDSKPFVLVYPGGRRWYKRWPPDRFGKLADQIGEHFQMPVLFCGGNEDMVISSAILRGMKTKAYNIAGQLSLLDFAALAQKAVCLVGNDSAPIHIATAVNTPVVALFGPTDWRAWAPRREHDRVLSAEFACRPCGHSNVDCPFGEKYCMSTITEHQVWEAVKDLIERNAKVYQ